MNILEAIITRFYGEDIFVVDGFDEAVIGIEESTMRLIYSVVKCLEITEAQGIPEDEALEHFYYNIQDTYIGEKTAIFCFDDFTDVE